MALFGRNKNTLEEEKKLIQDSSKEYHRITVDNEIDPESIDKSVPPEIKKWVEQLKSNNLNKEALFQIYDKMSTDSIISAALELLVEDVCSVDRVRNKRVWATPTNDDDSKADGDSSSDTIGMVACDIVNDFLKDYNMDDTVKTYAYQLMKYGEVFFKTYKSEFEEGNVPSMFKNRYGSIFEMVDNPQDILALELFDTLCGFGVRKRDLDDKPAQGYDVVPSDEYIYMNLDRNHTRKKVKLKYYDDGEEKVANFKYVIPSSYLESARAAWAIMDLIETLLLYVRFGHADFFNLIQVEVGSAGREETAKIIRSLKRSMENQDAMDIKQKTYEGYSKPLPKNSAIYVTTRQGKGQVTVQPVAPVADIKNIIDLEYWLDKLCAALRIPKAYLGLSDDNMSGLGNQTLTQMSIVYCRLVAYIQESMRNGIKAITDFYLKTHDMEQYVDTYDINMSAPLSVEDANDLQYSEQRIAVANELFMLLMNIPNFDMEAAYPILLDKLVQLGLFAEDFEDIDSFFKKEDDVDPTKPENPRVSMDLPVDFGGNK